MKKNAFILVTVALTFALTSCKVNWFEQQYDVPWWGIAVPVVIICAIVVFGVGKAYCIKRVHLS